MKNRFLILAMLISFFAAGCDDAYNDDTNGEPRIEFAADTDLAPAVDASGSTFSVAFTSSLEWSVEVVCDTDEPWCSVTPASGDAGTRQIRVDIEPNETPDERSATLTFICQTVSVSMTVTQSGKEPDSGDDDEDGKGGDEGDDDGDEDDNGDEGDEGDEGDTPAQPLHNKIYYKNSYYAGNTLLAPYGRNNGNFEVEEWPFGEGVEIVDNTYSEQEGGVITFNADVTRLGNAVFAYARISEITIPESVEVIADLAFFNSSLESIIIPDGVKVLGDRVFQYSFSLKTATVPGSIEQFGHERPQMFSYCNKLEAFYGPFATSDHRCLVIDGELKNFAPAGITAYTIPSGIHTLSNSGCFQGCEEIEELTIPATVTDIRDFALSHTTALRRFYCPYATEDGRAIIMNGKMVGFAPAGLTSYEVPEGVTELNRSVFDSCSEIESITLPSTLTKFGDYTFYYCRNLYDIHFKSTVPPVIEIPSYMYPFTGIAAEARIYVPAESVEAYKSADVWNRYADMIVSEEEAGQVVYSELHYTSTDGEIVQPNYYELYPFGAGITVESNTYENGEGVIRLCGPAAISKIGSYTFINRPTLSTITIPESVTSIDSYAFYGCNSVRKLVVESLTPPTLGYNVFNLGYFGLIYVPREVVGLYREQWSDYADIITYEGEGREKGENAYIITLNFGRNNEASMEYYQAVVDWVYENVDVPLGSTDKTSGQYFVTNYGNNEYYTGASAYYNEIDLRAAVARAQYAGDSYQGDNLVAAGLAFEGDGYGNLADEYVQELMLKRFQYVMGKVLEQKHPEAKPADVYVLQLAVYTGYTISTTNAEIIYEVGDSGEFRFLDMIKHY